MARHPDLPGRWMIANHALEPFALGEGKRKRVKVAAAPERIVDDAVALLGGPTIRPATRRALVSFARTSLAAATKDWERDAYPPLVANAVRQLLAVSPDVQTS